MKQNKKYTEIMKLLNFKPIGSVLLRLFGVSKRLKKCSHRFSVEDVCNTKVDPFCKKGCGSKLSELTNVC